MARRPQPAKAGPQPGKENQVFTVTVTGDLDTWKEGDKLTERAVIIAYYRAQAEVDAEQALDDDVWDAITSVKGDNADAEVERVELIEKLTKPIEEIVLPTPAGNKSMDGRSMMALGASLSSDTNLHFSMYTGKAKEDFDGSAVVIYFDFEEEAKKTEGELTARLLGFKAGAFPIGATDRNGNPKKGALPSGSELVPERYPIAGKANSYGSLVEDFCDGTVYGKKLGDTVVFLDDYRKWLGSKEGSSKPTDEQIKWFHEAHGFTKPVTFNARTVDSFLKRYNKRLTNFYNKMRQYCRLLQQMYAMDAIPGLDWEWVHESQELSYASSAPLRLMYKYRPEGATRDRTEPSANLSLGTFCNYDVESAWANHKPHADFLTELAETVGRDRDPANKRAVISLERPTVSNVVEMSRSIAAYLKDDGNWGPMVEWVNGKAQAEGDQNKLMIYALWKRIDKFYVDYCKARVNAIHAEDLRRAAAEIKQQEAVKAALAKGHDIAA